MMGKARHQEEVKDEESIQERKHFIRLNSIILNYGLPIDTWEINGWDE